MRIYTKIQLILESNLDFQGFINIIQTHPEIQPAVEFGFGFLILITPWMPRHVSALWGRFNMTVYQVVNHDKFNPRLYFRSFLCGWRNADKCFCRPTHLRMRQKTATMFNHRLYYLANTTSRCEFILKYNLWLNWILFFLRGYKCTPNPKYSPWLSWTQCFKILCDSLSGCKPW